MRYLLIVMYITGTPPTPTGEVHRIPFYYEGECKSAAAWFNAIKSSFRATCIRPGP